MGNVGIFADALKPFKPLLDRYHVKVHCIRFITSLGQILFIASNSVRCRLLGVRLVFKPQLKALDTAFIGLSRVRHVFKIQ